MVEDFGVLTSVLMDFLDMFSRGYSRLRAPAGNLFICLLHLEIVVFGLLVAFNKSELIGPGLKKIFRLSFLGFVGAHLPDIHQIILESAIYLGVTFSNEAEVGWIFKDPSAIIGYGLETIQPILNWMSNISLINIATQIHTILIAFVVIVVVLFSYFYLALQVFVTLIEFYFNAAVMIVFLSFRVFSVTSWMGEGAVRSFFNHAIKIFILTVIIGIIQPMLEEVMMEVDVFGAQEMWRLLVFSILMLVLSYKAGSWAASLASGSPGLGGGDFVGGAAMVGASAVGAATGGAVAAKMALPLGGQAAHGVASLMGGAKTGGALKLAASSSSSPLGKAGAFAGGSLQGAGRVMMAPASNAISRIGKNLQHSMTQGSAIAFKGSGGTIGKEKNSASVRGKDTGEQGKSTGPSFNMSGAATKMAKSAYQMSHRMSSLENNFNQINSPENNTPGDWPTTT